MSLIKDFLGLFDSGIAKLALILAILAAIISYVNKRDAQNYTAGFNASQASYMAQEKALREEIYNEYSERINELTTQLTVSQEASTSSSNRAAELQQELDDRPIIEITRRIGTIQSQCELSEDYNEVVKQLVSGRRNE
jgi:hypothetical protein